MPRSTARYRVVPGQPSKHGANIGAADVRRGQDGSVSWSCTGGPEIAEAVDTVGNYLCWVRSKVDAPRVKDGAGAVWPEGRGSLLHVAIDLG